MLFFRIPPHVIWHMTVTDHCCPPGPGAGQGSAQGCPARGYWWQSGQRTASPLLQATVLAAPEAGDPLR